MLNLTTEQQELFKQDSVYKQLVIRFTDSTIPDITNSDIMQESMSLTEILCDTEQIQFGAIGSAKFEVDIANIDSTLIGKEIKPYLVVNGLEIPLGVFIVKNVEKLQDKAYKRVTALDKSSLLDANVNDWYDSLTFPITVKNFRDSLFTYLGLEQEETSLDIDNLTIEQTLEIDVIPRDVLSDIAELDGKFGRFNRLGKFEWFSLKTSEPYSLVYRPSIMRTTPMCSDYVTEVIDGVKLFGESGSFYKYGGDTNIYIVRNNFLLNNKDASEMNSIAIRLLAKISKVTYKPTSLEMMGQPYIEVGDYLSHDGVVDSTQFYMFSRTLNGTQALKDKVECKGDEYLTVDNGIVSQLMSLNRQTSRLKIDIQTTTEGIRSEVAQNYASKEEVNTSLADLQNQIDGAVETYFHSGEPTLANYPANDWKSVDDKNKHIGDLYYDKNTGKAYRFMLDSENNTYLWTPITDEDISKALDTANKAQQSADAVATNLATNYSTTTQTNSVIEQKTNELTQRVESTETTVATVTKTANDAKTTADNASKTANTANTNASSALTTAQSLETRVSSAEQKITADAIVSTVRSSQSYQDDISAEETVSRINQTSSTVKIDAKNIDLNGVVTANGTFKILEDGTMVATGGKIGGFDISNAGLDVEIAEDFGSYTQEDYTRILNIIAKTVTPTETDYKRYDFNKDGKITITDGIRVLRIVNGIDPQVQKGNVKIDSTSLREAIKITQNGLNHTTTIGAGFVNTTDAITAKDFITTDGVSLTQLNNDLFWTYIFGSGTIPKGTWTTYNLKYNLNNYHELMFVPLWYSNVYPSIWLPASDFKTRNSTGNRLVIPTNSSQIQCRYTSPTSVTLYSSGTVDQLLIYAR